MELSNITSKELAELGSDCLLIIPFGSLEAHSQHLPMGTDSIILNSLLSNLSFKIHSQILLSPFIDFTPINVVRTRGEDGLLNIKIDTIKWNLCIEDIVFNMINCYKPKDVLLVTWHDTFDFISALRTICFRIKEKTNYLIDALRIWDIALDYSKRKKMVDSKERHAAFIETSIMMYLKPDLVKTELITIGDWAKKSYLAVDWNSFNEIGIYGNASNSSKEYGEEIFLYTLSQLEKYLFDFFYQK
jgi:creatinine amidohydrolase